MTPFMARVADLIEGSATGDRPQLRDSGPRPVVDGADEQVMTRSLAEQLVSEANAVLLASGNQIDLADEIVEGQLGFVMRYSSRAARVSTSFTSRCSIGKLQGVGARCHGDVALDGPEQVENLILLLIGTPA
jgi:hypothetical protein